MKFMSFFSRHVFVTVEDFSTAVCDDSVGRALWSAPRAMGYEKSVVIVVIVLFSMDVYMCGMNWWYACGDIRIEE